jgi:hypothetical protein
MGSGLGTYVTYTLGGALRYKPGEAVGDTLGTRFSTTLGIFVK